MHVIPFNPSYTLKGFPLFVNEETEAQRVGTTFLRLHN